MGGSGGSIGFFDKRTDVERLKEELRRAEKRTIDEAYEAKVQQKLGELLVDYNGKDDQKIGEYLERVKKVLEQDIEGSVDLRFAGSVKKHTYVDGLSDVDCLVFLRDPDLGSMAPGEVIEYFRAKLEERLGSSARVSAGQLAVTVEYSDGTKIQLLPAIKKGEGLVIASERGDKWSPVIRPDRFARRLSAVNQEYGYKVVPTIKLAKAAIADLLGEDRVTGYHIESIAIEAFKGYSGPKTTRAMLQHFFDKGKDLVLTNIKDRTGQSLNVDDYLGDDGSDVRRALSQRFDRISRRMKNSDAMGSPEEWLRAIEQ